MTTSENLRRARMRAGLNGKELADKLGMLPGTYRQVESGRRQLQFELAVKISEILRCDLSELTGNGSEELGRAESVTEATKTLPVFGKSTLISSQEVEFVNSGTSVPRPEIVATSGEAYAFRVFNDLAGPRFEVGDTLICDPSIPIKPTMWAVVAIKKGDKILAEIHRIMEYDIDGDRVLIERDSPLSLSACASIDAIVATLHT